MNASRPHRVAVLVLPTVISLELGTVTEVFGRDPYYELTVCAESPTSTVSGCGFTINTTDKLDALDATRSPDHNTISSLPSQAFTGPVQEV